jgi:hypothetical protein
MSRPAVRIDDSRCGPVLMLASEHLGMTSITWYLFRKKEE